jgi:hypothetical protein
MKSTVLTMLPGCTVLLTIAIAADGQTPANSYRVVSLVSDVAGAAAGLSNPNSPFWIGDHGSRLTTVYVVTGSPAATAVKITAAAQRSRRTHRFCAIQYPEPE